MCRNIKVLIIVTVMASLLGTLGGCDQSKKEVSSSPSKESINMKESTQQEVLRHVVLFKFNSAASDSIVEKIEQEFIALPEQISEIHSFEWGVNNSPEGLNKGLTHCFLVTFLSEEDRAAYLPHPAHQRFVEFIGPYVEDVAVVDYWTK